MEFGENSFQKIEEDIEEISEEPKLNKVEKKQLISARVGQGLFRQKLIQYWGGCAVTGARDSKLLFVTHIKPWSVCSNDERLDINNGLVLVPNLHNAFDKGLISFKDSGEILCSLDKNDADRLGINLDMKVNLTKAHTPYIKYHRENIYRGT